MLREENGLSIQISPNPLPFVHPCEYESGYKFSGFSRDYSRKRLWLRGGKFWILGVFIIIKILKNHIRRILHKIKKENKLDGK